MGGRTKIDWCDATINPVIGCSKKPPCRHCYARKMNARWKWVENFSKPQFFPRALKQPYKWKKPRIIFVCSLGELFDPQVPRSWVHRVFVMMEENPQHRFLLLTQQACRAARWVQLLPKNAWLGVTITGPGGINYFVMNDGQNVFSREIGGRVFISFEPLRGKIDWQLYGVNWAIIGAQTNPTVQPKRVWVQEILDRADAAGIPVLMKHNLIWPAGERRFEFPADLEKIRSGR